MALTEDLIAYWNLDEASGTRTDSHGTNHLTDNNTVGSAAGLRGTAADFERDDTESLTIADNTGLSAGDVEITFAAWVKLESKTNELVIFSKGTSGSGAYYVWYSTGVDRFRFTVYGGASFTNQG